MKYSVIDIGSNTIKASVFDCSKKSIELIDYFGIQAGLITYVSDLNGHKILTDDGIKVLFDSFEKLVRFSEKHECKNIFALATAAIRQVENRDEIVKLLYNKYKIQIDILSESDEAIFSLKGLLNSEKAGCIKKGIMIDMGGGSTEVVLFENGTEPIVKSLGFGCLKLYDLFVSGDYPNALETEKIKEYVCSTFNEIEFAMSANCPVFLIGGTARAVLKIADKLHKNKLEDELFYDGFFFKYIYENLNVSGDLQKLVKEEIPKRVKTVAPGSIAYFELIKFINATSIIVSDSGVREGYLQKILN